MLTQLFRFAVSVQNRVEFATVVRNDHNALSETLFSRTCRNHLGLCRRQNNSLFLANRNHAFYFFLPAVGLVVIGTTFVIGLFPRDNALSLHGVENAYHALFVVELAERHQNGTVADVIQNDRLSIGILGMLLHRLLDPFKGFYALFAVSSLIETVQKDVIAVAKTVTIRFKELQVLRSFIVKTAREKSACILGLEGIAATEVMERVFGNALEELSLFPVTAAIEQPKEA